MLRLFENAKLLNQLETDKLTGVLTAEFFYRHVERALHENPDTQYEIVCSNINSFKLINTRNGKETGEKLLRYIADHYKSCAGKSGLCGRLGVDVFAILREARPLRSQKEIGEIFAKTFKDAPIRNFSMQYGVFPIQDISMPVSEMCDCALLAIESIKHKFGVYYAVYDEDFCRTLMREHQLNDCKEQALADQQFQVYLQPKHDTNTGDIAGAEALVRWNHPELGFISPGEFIPLFERDGFISALDYYVWDVVCQTLKRWHDEGKNLIPISVNVSRIDFGSENLAENIANLVDAYGIPPEMLHLEVTESAYTDDPKQIIATVSILQSMGFKIEMDDFGSGYSSLNMLSELPIDVLKLDMRFMKEGGIRTVSNKRSILSFVVSLSKWLHLPTVAEGVETGDEVEILKSMGCNYIQGFYFSRPIPIPEFEMYKERYAVQMAKSAEPADPTKPPIENLDNPLVLIVEDIATNRELLSRILREDYRIATAENGEIAYQYIKEHRGEIACIALDLLMPVMDGFQLLELMRTDGTLNEIPVIITSEVGTDSEIHALELGAEDFVAKPYNPKIILHHVRRCVDTYRFRSHANGKQGGE